MTMNLASMLPFLDEEGLQILVDGLIDGSLTDISLGEILHFLEDEQIKELYNHYAAHPEKGVSTMIFLPFMDDDDVDKEFLRQFGAGKINNEILPFVSDEALHSIVEQYVANPDWNLDIDDLYPFLDDDDLTLLLKAYLKHKSSANATKPADKD